MTPDVPPGPVPQPRTGLPNSIGAGVGFAILCDLVLLVILGAAFPFSLFAFGLLEWIGLLPLYLVARKQGARQTAKGVLIVGLIIFLLQAACWGLIAVIGLNFH